MELQDKFDELEDLGVSMNPEDHDITVGYVNPSFLVKKASVGHRLPSQMWAGTASHNHHDFLMWTPPYAKSDSGR